MLDLAYGLTDTYVRKQKMLASFIKHETHIFFPYRKIYTLLFTSFRSRLGCQVTLTKELAGVEVEVPAGVIDQRS